MDDGESIEMPRNEPGFSFPGFPYLWRAAGLGLASWYSARMAFRLLRRTPLALPVALPFAAFAFLGAWGTLVLLAGGQQYDDHPWE